MEQQRRAATAMEFNHPDAASPTAGPIGGDIAPTALPEGMPGLAGDQPDTNPGGKPFTPAQQAGDPSQPFVREGRKVGRNEPCPCGSGKKYKQCHGKLS